MRNHIYQRSFSTTEVSLIQVGGRRCQQGKLTSWWEMGFEDRTSGIAHPRSWRWNWALLLLMLPLKFIKRELAQTSDGFPSQCCFWQVVGNNFGSIRVILTPYLGSKPWNRVVTDRERNSVPVVWWRFCGGLIFNPESRGEIWMKNKSRGEKLE